MQDFTLSMPHHATAFTNIMTTALTLWREASNQDLLAKQAVMWVIRNRVDHPSWYGSTWHEVCTKKCQFTSMNPPDKLVEPNLRRWPSPDDASWKECLKVVFDVMVSNVPDPTGGATFYYDKTMDDNPPPWAKTYAHTVDVGAFHFFKPGK